MTALIDTNVIVDVLQQREPWFEAGKEIFLAVANHQITGCITAKEAADIHYFARKQFKGQDHVDEKARQVLSKLFSLFEVLDTLALDCQNALVFDNNDYEDAVMMATAQRAGVDCVVTRNPEHYRVSPAKVYSPVQCLDIMRTLPEGK